MTFLLDRTTLYWNTNTVYDQHFELTLYNGILFQIWIGDGIFFLDFDLAKEFYQWTTEYFVQKKSRIRFVGME